jgi:hypothetical protein
MLREIGGGNYNDQMRQHRARDFDWHEGGPTEVELDSSFLQPHLLSDLSSDS